MIVATGDRRFRHLPDGPGWCHESPNQLKCNDFVAPWQARRRQWDNRAMQYMALPIEQREALMRSLEDMPQYLEHELLALRP